MIYVLKATGMAATLATAWLMEQGHVFLALAAVPGLAVMWWVTRDFARRRARPGGRS